MKRRLFAVLLLGLPGAIAVGCDLPKRAAATPVPTTYGPAPSPPVPEAGARTFARAPEPGGLETVAPPRDGDGGAPCTLTTDKGIFDLSPLPGLAPLLSARDSRVSVTLIGASSWIEMVTRDVRVHGHGSIGSVHLYAKRASRFTDCCALSGETRLLPTHAADGKVESELYFGAKQRRFASYTCDDLTLTPVLGTMPGELVPGHATAPLAVVMASLVKPTLVADTAEGPTTSQLEGRVAVRVLGNARGRTRVAWVQNASIQVAWVPTETLAPAGTSLVTPSQQVMVVKDDVGSVNPDEDEHPPEVPRGPRWVCQHDVRLVLRVAGGRSFTIGWVTKGARIALAARQDGALAEIARATLDVSVEEHTTLLVPRRDLEDCTPESAPTLGKP